MHTYTCMPTDLAYDYAFVELEIKFSILCMYCIQSTLSHTHRRARAHTHTHIHMYAYRSRTWSCICSTVYTAHTHTNTYIDMYAYRSRTWPSNIVFENFFRFYATLHVLCIQQTHTHTYTYAHMHPYLVFQHSIRDQVVDSIESILHWIDSTCGAMACAECRNNAQVHDVRRKIQACVHVCIWEYAWAYAYMYTAACVHVWICRLCMQCSYFLIFCCKIVFVRSRCTCVSYAHADDCKAWICFDMHAWYSSTPLFFWLAYMCMVVEQASPCHKKNPQKTHWASWHVIVWMQQKEEEWTPEFELCIRRMYHDDIFIPAAGFASIAFCAAAFCITRDTAFTKVSAVFETNISFFCTSDAP